MKLIYLYHSGFALLGDDFTLIFDYWKDSESDGDGILHRELLKRPGRMYVFASHAHADHFNPEVLSWRLQRPDIVYLLSQDIQALHEAEQAEAVWLKQGDSYSDERLSVHAFGSTDVGISFLVEVDGRKIFHAGDLNNWHWMDECEEAEWKGYEHAFLQELQFIRKYTETVDVAMFPVDPRLGKEYMRGPQQFVEMIKTFIFVPMHFDEAYARAAAFRPLAEAEGARMIALERRGQCEEIECETLI